MLRCARPVRGTLTPATGTDAGYQRHWRAREEPCEPCARAHSVHVCLDQKANPGSHRDANQRWRDANPGYFARRQHDRLREDVNFRLARILRKRLWDAVTSQDRKGSSVLQLLGCSIDELKAHLEARFTAGMSWGNYGALGWEVDHVRPVASFDLTDPEQQRRCFHYTNLQPLWWLENRRKRDCFVRSALAASDDEEHAGP